MKKIDLSIDPITGRYNVAKELLIDSILDGTQPEDFKHMLNNLYSEIGQELGTKQEEE